MQKICKTCKSEKDVEEFPIQDTKLNLYRAHCKECYSKKRKEIRVSDLDKLEIYKERGRQYYHDNKEVSIKNITEYQKENKDKVKIWQKNFRIKEKQKWLDFKNTLKCEKCGENDGSCLDFHHVDPDKKLDVVSKLRMFKAKLKEELKKCIVLCSNCHRKLHAKEKQNNQNK